MDYNGDDYIDNVERLWADEAMCTSREEHESLFGDAGDFDTHDDTSYITEGGSTHSSKTPNPGSASSYYEKRVKAAETQKRYAEPARGLGDAIKEMLISLAILALFIFTVIAIKS